MTEFCKVYLSSSFKDLQAHREAVYTALNQLTNIKVIAMEDYVARDDRPLAACLDDVRGCDIYVGIFAWRYGYVPPEAENPRQLSITELELEAAREAKKPCLVFVLAEDAAWHPNFFDSHIGENGSGARIRALRARLFAERLASPFSGDPVALGSLVCNAVSNQLLRAPVDQKAEAIQRLQREVSHAFYLAHHPLDSTLAASLAQQLAEGLERRARVSGQALFASDANAVAQREESLVSCHAAVVLVTAASLPGLLAQRETVDEALQILRARSGALVLLLAGVAPAALPPEWGGYRQMVLPDASEPASDEALSETRAWLAARQPPPEYRSVGVPICIVAMTAAELADLQADPDLQARLTGAEYAQLTRLVQTLAGASADWTSRYRATRHAWRPFGAGGMSMRRLAEHMADEVGVRGPGRQRQRHVRLQWYPFDCLVDNNLRLRPVYREVARVGCVVLVDEVSLFHPVLRDAFQNSPFFNNDQVAIVTISPMDPARGAIEALLESAARQRLAGAFDRYAVEFDPQCELAVGDERRLKRWLHASLPATLMRLQEPRPDRSALGALAAELGESGKRSKRDYLWGGGVRS